MENKNFKSSSYWEEELKKFLTLSDVDKMRIVREMKYKIDHSPSLKMKVRIFIAKLKTKSFFKL